MHRFHTRNVHVTAHLVAPPEDPHLHALPKWRAKGGRGQSTQHVILTAVGAVNAPITGFSNPAHEILALQAGTRLSRRHQTKTTRGGYLLVLGDLRRFGAPAAAATGGGHFVGAGDGAGTGAASDDGAAMVMSDSDRSLVQVLLDDRGTVAIATVRRWRARGSAWLSPPPRAAA